MVLVLVRANFSERMNLTVVTGEIEAFLWKTNDGPYKLCHIL